MMNQFYIVTLRKGKHNEEFVISHREANNQYEASNIAKSRVLGLGWVVALLETGLVLDSTPNSLTS